MLEIDTSSKILSPPARVATLGNSLSNSGQGISVRSLGGAEEKKAAPPEVKINGRNPNEDTVEISGQGRSRSAEEQGLEKTGLDTGDKEQKEGADSKPEIAEPGKKTKPSGEQLTEEEQQEVKELEKRDAEVKQHEQAHLAAAGDLAKGSADFQYQTGPDGKRYAVGGEVSIDTSKVPGDPQATIEKAQKIRRAATAPAEPSSQDRAVAATASRMEAQARVELAEQRREKQQVEQDELKQKQEAFKAQQEESTGDDEQAPASTVNDQFYEAQQRQVQRDISDTYQRIQNATLAYSQGDVIVVDLFV